METIKELLLRKIKLAEQVLEDEIKQKEVDVQVADIRIAYARATLNTLENLSDLDWDRYAKLQLGV